MSISIFNYQVFFLGFLSNIYIVNFVRTRMRGKVFILFVLVLWIQHFYVCRGHHATCDRTFSKFDCVDTYQKSKRVYNELILTDRDAASPKASGIPTDWFHWEEYLLGLVCRCLERLNRISEGNLTIYNQFTVENYGECWSTRNGYDFLNTFTRSDSCVGVGFLQCQNDYTSACTGTELSGYLYQVHNRTKLLDEHCHIVRRIVCPSLVTVHNSSSPSRRSQNQTVWVNASSTRGQTETDSLSLKIQSQSSRSMPATTLKITSVDSTLLTKISSNQTSLILSPTQTLNTGVLLTSESKFANLNLAPTQLLITAFSSLDGNKTNTAKLSTAKLAQVYPVFPSTQPETTSTQVANETYPAVSLESSTVTIQTNILKSTISRINTSPFEVTSTKTLKYSSKLQQNASMAESTNDTVPTIWNSLLSSLKQSIITTYLQAQSSANDTSILPNSFQSQSYTPKHTPQTDNVGSFEIHHTSNSVSVNSQDTTNAFPDFSTSNSLTIVPTSSTVSFNETPNINTESSYYLPQNDSSIQALPSQSTYNLPQRNYSTQDLNSQSWYVSPQTNVSIQELPSSQNYFLQRVTSAKNLFSEPSYNKTFKGSYQVTITGKWSPGNGSSASRQSNMTLESSPRSTMHVTDDVAETSSPIGIIIAGTSSKVTFKETWSPENLSPSSQDFSSPASSTELLLTSFHGQQGSSSLVEGTTTTIQRSLSSLLKPSFETSPSRETKTTHYSYLKRSVDLTQTSTKVDQSPSSLVASSVTTSVLASSKAIYEMTLSKESKSVLRSSVSKTLTSIYEHTNQVSTTKLSLLISTYSGYNMKTRNTVNYENSASNLTSNYDLVSSRDQAILNSITSVLGSSANHKTTTSHPKKSFPDSSSSITLTSAKPNCKNTVRDCKGNTGTNFRLSDILVLLVAQIMLINFP